MSNAIVQLGTALKIGIGGYTYDGHIVEEAGIEPGAEEEVIRGEDNETHTVLVSDRAENLNLQVIGKAGSTVAALKIGDTILVNDVDRRVTSLSVTRQRGALRARIGCRKEVSMNYTPPEPP